MTPLPCTPLAGPIWDSMVGAVSSGASRISITSAPAWRAEQSDPHTPDKKTLSRYATLEPQS